MEFETPAWALSCCTIRHFVAKPSTLKKRKRLAGDQDQEKGRHSVHNARHIDNPLLQARQAYRVRTVKDWHRWSETMTMKMIQNPEAQGVWPDVVCVVQEGLRMHPVGNPMFSPCRVCTQDTVLGGHKIPKGVGIMLNSPFISRDPKYFPEPDVSFRPWRKLSDHAVYTHATVLPMLKAQTPVTAVWEAQLP